MSGYLNRVTLIGNLGADPEIHHTASGKTIATLRLATSERWTDQRTGEKREQTEWHRIVIFNEGLAGLAEKYLTCGSKILVEGKLSTRSWEDQTGTKRYTTEIVVSPYSGQLVFLNTRRENEPEKNTPRTTTPVVEREEVDSDIPF
jgi:single-strand DNA-binding protein